MHASLTRVKVTHDDLISYLNGQAALLCFHNPEMEVLGKRKRDDADEWRSERDGSSSDPMDVDDDDGDPVVSRHRAKRSRSARSLPPRAAATRQSSHHRSSPSDEDDDDVIYNDNSKPQRSLRPRKASMNFPVPVHGELQEDPLDDDDFAIVTSDITKINNKTRPRPRRVQSRRPIRAPTRQKSPDSDIEFEAPRRSNRSTRNQLDMKDDVLMDDDSFYITEEKAPGTPKVISVREIFQPTNPDSAFASTHNDFCHTCGGSRQRGQLVYCQGCSLTFHKNCIGYRSGREHMVTKIGEEDFVLQCKYCIGAYKKKDSNAPSYDMCQTCKKPGKACAAFSEKKTSRQEEKLREQNGGVDPITPVSPDLVNNSELVLFRCVKCHRGWHIDHLPPTGRESVTTDVQSERLKDYSIDWQCNECSSAKHRIHRLVAWKPIPEKRPPQSSQGNTPSLLDFDEDSKEYLIKWESTSYFHCSWKPSAWVFGTAASIQRSAFAKRDAEKSLLHYSEKDAIPEEYLMPDIIFNLKMDSSSYVQMKSKEDELAQAPQIRKIFVKFQGLGYDDVVWDTPPKPSDGQNIYNAFAEAYHDYLDGKYFESEPYYRIRDRIKEYKAAPFEEVDTQPHGLQRGKLMSYQIEGLNWLLENYHDGKSIVLADEMGLGKTVQVVSLVASLVQDKPRVSISALEAMM